MGQRSQIYIRIKDKYNKTSFYAKYYQWNYGERMISRARHGIEYIKNMVEDEFLGLESTREQVNRIFDVNFDMHDIMITHDLIKEWGEYGGKEDKISLNYYVFNADNNDGRLFIDVDENKKTIKYCFTDYDNKILSSPHAYMDWDYEDWLKSEYLSDKAREICVKNMQYIENNAILMTQDELDEYLNYDYESLLGEIPKF